MVFPFGKKKESSKLPPQQDYVPVDIVQRYVSQGLSEPEIITRLQSHGFRPSQIDRALKMAVKREVGRTPAPPIGPPTQRPIGPEPIGEMRPPSGPPYEVRREQLPPRPMPSEPIREAPRPRLPTPPPRNVVIPPRSEPSFRELPPPQQRPREMPMGAPPERVVGAGELGMPSFGGEERGGFTFERPTIEKFEGPEITLEEVVEGIVAERWEEFEERLGSFEKRDIQLQQQIEDARKKVDEVTSLLKSREETFSNKLDNFGDSVENIEGRIGSIEKVFRDFLPELIENVKTMSQLVEKVKKK